MKNEVLNKILSKKVKNMAMHTAIMIVAGVVTAPFVFIISLFGGGWLVHNVYRLWHNYLGFDWTAFNSRRIDIRRFLEFWHVGAGILIIFVFIYTVMAMLLKRFESRPTIFKLRYYSGGISIIYSLLLMYNFDFRRPISGGFMASDWSYRITYAYIFATIMFLIFILTSIILDKFTKWKELFKIPLAFISSLAIGGVISHAVWVVMFRYFHG